MRVCGCVCVPVGWANICLVTTNRLLQIHISNPQSLLHTHTHTPHMHTHECRHNTRPHRKMAVNRTICRHGNIVTFGLSRASVMVGEEKRMNTYILQTGGVPEAELRAHGGDG